MRFLALSCPRSLRRVVVALLCLPLTTTLAWAEEPMPTSTVEQPRKTRVEDAHARKQLLGPHGLTLQWIATNGRYDVPGQATVTEKDGLLTLQGEQHGDRGNSLRVDGIIERVEEKSFILVGRVETRVSFIDAGRPCVREGRFTFRITGKRRYWRMKEMDNPCGDVTDYVDVYLR